MTPSRLKRLSCLASLVLLLAGHKRRGEKTPIVTAIMPEKLADTVKAAEEMGVEHLIIDTAPKMEHAMLAAMRLADTIIVPIRACLLDLSATADTIELLKTTGKLEQSIGVLNAVQPTRGKKPDDPYVVEGAHTIEALGLKVARAVLHHRPAFERANNEGLGVIEYRHHGRQDKEAIKEVTALWRQLSAPGKKAMAKTKRGKEARV